MVGTWKRTIRKEAVSIETRLFFTLSEEQHQAVSLAGERYRSFLQPQE
ncbi:hypothetical protein [Spirosoma telluris]